MVAPNAKRLTDADRELAAARLREAFIHGVLTHEELNVRIEAALHAKSTDDMAPILDDIPILTTTPEPIRLAISNGHVDRMGIWRVPSQIALELNHATSTLDFRTPTLPSDGVRLSVQAVRSRIVILVRSSERVAYENLGRHHGRILDRTRTPRQSETAEVSIHVFGDLRSSSLRILPPRRGLVWR